MMTENLGGFERSSLKQLTDVIQQDIDQEKYDGAVVIMARKGEVALREGIGFADRDGGRAMQEDNVFCLFSVTKAFTAATVLQRVERGEIRLNTPVAEIIPEFGIIGKQRVTIAQLLTHTGGMSGAFPAVELEEQGNLEKVVAACCQMPLERLPGKAVKYSRVMAHAVLAEVVHRLDGGQRSFREIIDHEVFHPLGMKDTSLGIRPDLTGRLAPPVVRDETPGLFKLEDLVGLIRMTVCDPSKKAEIPAGGCVSTADDVFRFAEAMRRGGELDGRRILSPAMVTLAAQNHTGSMPNNLLNYCVEMRDWPVFPAFLGMGFFLRGTGIHPTYFGTMASPGTFGAMGAGSTIFWIDPERDITFVCLTTGLIEESYSCDRFQRLSDLALAAAV
jgi:CubicO group peptidase (beta-lactamase class C family)